MTIECKVCEGTGLLTCAQLDHAGCETYSFEVELEPASEFFPSRKEICVGRRQVNHVCESCGGRGRVDPPTFMIAAQRFLDSKEGYPHAESLAEEINGSIDSADREGE